MISITRIPNCATSAASDSPIAVTAAFDARYVPRNGTGASVDDDVMLQITPPPAARMIGTARFVTSTSPNTLVANKRCHDSSGMCSTGRLSLSTPALLTSTRKPSGSAMLEGSVTSSRSTRIPDDPKRSSPSVVFLIEATVSKPRAASSIATARPIPRLAPVTTAVPLGSMRDSVPRLAMDLRFTADQERFRAEARTWLTDRLDGRFAVVRGRGGPGDEHELFAERLEWEQELGRDGWIGLGWPAEYGGRGATLLEQVIFYEEYARAGGPGRVGIVGEGLLGPTIVHFGDDAQKRRVLPGILRGTEIWCQGYSEPDAGSDLANVQTRAEPDGDEWVLHGQKVWTSLAHWAQWIFVIARTDRAAPKHKGLSYLLVPMHQPGRIEIRPIVQITGHSEFNETFFDGARTAAENVVGEVNAGWRVAMGTLAFARADTIYGGSNQIQRNVIGEQALGLPKEPR